MNTRLMFRVKRVEYEFIRDFILIFHLILLNGDEL